VPSPPAALPDSPFWRFSLGFYGRPGVAAACLALQDRHGADVNLILLALWLGTLGHRLDRPTGDRLARLARRWQMPALGPLRRVRRLLKRRIAAGCLPWPEAVEAVRGRLAAVELELEQVEQLLLEASAGPAAPASPDAAAANHNLMMLGLAGLAETAEARRLLAEAFS
jgi:uncharacterized protein (TIGR02444 family)